MKNLRRLYGRLFGFHQEIQELEKRVQELSWDEPFGMWTRGAFLQFCRVMPRGAVAVQSPFRRSARGRASAMRVRDAVSTNST